MENKRPDWPKYFMSMAFLASERSTCIRRHVGAVAVKGEYIIASGYNGPLSGRPHCTDETCYRLTNKIPSGQELEKCWAVHAEQNVVAQCARYGISLAGATVFVTHAPCVTCSKILLAAGVEYCIFANPYPDNSMSEDLWKDRLMQIDFHSTITWQSTSE